MTKSLKAPIAQRLEQPNYSYRMQAWKLQMAKARLGEVIRRAMSEGLQTITVRGERAAVVVSAAEYDRPLKGRPFVSAAEVLLAGPEWPEEMYDAIDSARARDLPRDIEL